MGESKRMALEVLEPTERKQVVRDFPVSVGLVFPDGELASVPIGRIVDDRGQLMPFEAEATGWWDAGHERVKRLLLHFRASTDRKYHFELGAAPKAPEGDPVAVDTSDYFMVSTGPLRATISRHNPRLFESVTLNNTPMLGPAEVTHVLVADDGTREIPGVLCDWAASLLGSTPARASVEARGTFRAEDGTALARLNLRYQFYEGEPFVRLTHTITWMVQDVNGGIREISMRFKPQTAGEATMHVGLSEYEGLALRAPLGSGTRVRVHQDEADHFTVTSAEKTLQEGARLGGWVAMEGEDGRAVSVSLRHAWQIYPTSFSAEDGELCVGFWQRYPFSKEVGHFVNNYEDKAGFMYTAEGAAWTHEMVIGFHDPGTERGPSELNSLNQHPLVVRQDPASAVRLPFLRQGGREGQA